MKKVLFMTLAVVLVTAGCTVQKNLTLDEAKIKGVEFINANLMQPGSEVTVSEALEENGLYKIVVNLPGREDTIDSYMTKDGATFFPQAMKMDEVTEEATDTAEAPTQPVTEVVKSDMPKVELFVMSFCPYGVVAETAMSPVVKLLGDEADINVRFISSITPGDPIEKVKALHGPVEGIENARQLCIAKNYDTQTLWKYIDKLNVDCYPIYRNDDVYKACWTATAKAAGIDENTISKCVTDEGPALIATDDTISKANSVSGSPTLLINGAKVNVARTPEAYKTAICDAYNNPPAVCSEVLSEDGATAEGGC